MIIAQVGVDPQTARDTAEDVLRQQPYVDASRSPSLQERALDWVVELVGDLLSALSSAGGRGFTAWIVITVFTLFAVWMVWRLVRSWSPIPKRATLPDPEVEIFADRSPQEWEADAQEAEQEGRWTDAIRLRHRALVTGLVDRSIIGSHPGQTAGSIAADVAAHSPQSAGAMSDLTVLFKQAWYGDVPMRTDDVERFRGLAADVNGEIDQVESGDTADATSTPSGAAV